MAREYKAYFDFYCEHCERLIEKGEGFHFDDLGRKVCTDCQQELDDE